MGFSVDKDRNNQQRIALSQHADDVIQNDCALFGCLSKDGGTPAYHAFINKVFCGFYEFSDASIERRIHERREELRRIRGDKDSDELRQFTEGILQDYKKELEDRVRGMLSGECVRSKVISLNVKTLEILRDSEESAAYSEGHVSRYIRAVMEDYASRDFLTRKKIYYRDALETFQAYIQSGSVIRFRLLGEKKKYVIKPAFVRADRYETHLYLAAMVCLENGDESFASYRIDRIDMKSVQCAYRSSIPQEAMKRLEKRVGEAGVQYLSSEKSIARIRIRLSPRGIKKYKSWTFQRPAYACIEGEKRDIYVFEIPYYQALVYFFKFGADAVVLEPEGLRNRFLGMYQEALKEYAAEPRGVLPCRSEKEDINII